MTQTITDEEIETLKGKCYTSINHSPLCTCRGTGKATIEIKKEWVECPECFGSGGIGDNEFNTSCNCENGKIPKYKVGDKIEVDLDFTKHGIWNIKLKILSETEDKWKVVMLR